MNKKLFGLTKLNYLGIFTTPNNDAKNLMR